MRRKANEATQQGNTSRLSTLKHATKKDLMDVNQNFLDIFFSIKHKVLLHLNLHTSFPTILPCIFFSLSISEVAVWQRGEKWQQKSEFRTLAKSNLNLKKDSSLFISMWCGFFLSCCHVQISSFNVQIPSALSTSQFLYGSEVVSVCRVVVQILRRAKSRWFKSSYWTQI